MSKLLELYADLEKAARGFRDAGDRNHYKGMGTTTGSDRMSVHEMRVAYAEVLATLDALAAYRAAHPGGETCETCRKWRVKRGHLGDRKDLMGVCKLKDGEGPPLWLESKDDREGEVDVVSVKTHGCEAWEERK
jgi:hypothetical protein